MADSFADLWASTAPTKPAEPPKKLGAAVPSPSYPRRPQQDAFSILSAAQPPNRTPAANTRPNDRNTRPPQSNSRGGDAFSSLFTSSLDGPAAGRIQDRSNMTIAERAALAQRSKAAQNSAPTKTNTHTSSSLWDGLDSLARPASVSPRPAQEATARDDFDFGFESLPASKSAPQVTSPANTGSLDDDWGISEFSSPLQSESRSTSANAKPTSGSKPTTLWDLDDFTSAGSQRHQPQRPSRSLTGTPGDFDFGDREDRLLDDDSDHEGTFGIRDTSGFSGQPDDDILGDLGKPVSHSPSPNPSTSTRPNSRPPPRMSASPPPHITGQLVEMGFSPIDARAALANTMNENGFDVQVAAELLLSQASGGTPGRPSPHPQERERRRDREQDRERDRDRDRATRRPPSNRSDPQSRPSPTPSPSHSQSQTQMDITAEKLITQASEIGRGMFSKANALWKEGKERAVKIYEERAAVSTANTGGSSTADGRPRWMRDQEVGPREDARQLHNETNGHGVANGGFRDDDDELREPGETQRLPTSRRPPQTQSRVSPQPESRLEREIDLFSADTPTIAYQSPFRRGKPKTQVSLPSAPPPVPSTQASSVSRSPPRPVTLTTTITLSALTSSTSHKSAGTESFKRGDFPAALTAYMRALSALPPQHVLRLPLLTNVALVRSKVGELRESIKDCEEAVTIVRRFLNGRDGNGRETSENAFGTSDSDFDAKAPINVGNGKVNLSIQGGGASLVNGDLPTSVDLIEGLTKAFRRRAEGLEGLEKWEMARGTWEVLAGADWAGTSVKGEALRGVGRCRRMIEGSMGSGSAGSGATTESSSQPIPPRPRPRPRPRPTPTTSSSTPSKPSAAITALRETENAQHNEDAAQLLCKDSVDARLTAWKGGREGNIRALLTSLDSVLWPELGWRRIGLAEVVGKGQVKGAYVRAIARVHPDKLNADNTTVEQRMIANGVFGALNEAWNVFQEQQQ